MDITEAEKREVVKKLEMIKRALPRFIKFAKEGKITKVSHEEMYVIEVPTLGVNSVNIKELSVIFPLCSGYSLEKQ
jgi:hypothetical protein